MYLWFRKIPYAAEQLSPRATAIKRVLKSPRTTTSEPTCRTTEGHAPWSLCTETTEATAVRTPRTHREGPPRAATRGQPAPQQRPSNHPPFRDMKKGEPRPPAPPWTPAGAPHPEGEPLVPTLLRETCPCLQRLPGRPVAPTWAPGNEIKEGGPDRGLPGVGGWGWGSWDSSHENRLTDGKGGLGMTAHSSRGRMRANWVAWRPDFPGAAREAP